MKLKPNKKFWNISPETGAFLNALIREKKYRRVLEIGTSNGYSGIWMAEALSHVGGHLYTMESEKKTRYPLAQKNFRESGLQNYITSILGHAPEDLPLTPKTFDMVFLDATKYEHPSYFSALKNRIKKNGIIITDNAISHNQELLPYKKLVSTEKNWENYLLNIGSGLLISVRVR